MFNLPTLYKLNNKQKMMQWTIQVKETEEGFGEIIVSHGQVEGKIQSTSDTVKKGKNIGKKNETNAYQQACSEAQSKWDKQIKDAYVDNIGAAFRGEIHESIKGSFEPMTAQKFHEDGHKIVFPAFLQPKLDGFRCLAVRLDGALTLWTRGRDKITSCPHIIAELERQIPEGDFVIDGELYNHEFRHEFEKIASAISKESPSELSAKCQLHVYDTRSSDDYYNRAIWIKKNLKDSDAIKIVKTVACNAVDDVPDLFHHFHAQGYEGAMVRNLKGGYEHTRSYNLQKVKQFDDAEFKVVGADEGRGKLAGHLGAWVCVNESGTEFRATPKCTQEQKKAFWETKEEHFGKMMTVQYMGLTNKEKVPRHPIALRFREEGL